MKSAKSDNYGEADPQQDDDPTPISDPGSSAWGSCSLGAAREALSAQERRFVSAATFALTILVLTQKLTVGFGIEMGVIAIWPFCCWAFARGYCQISPLRLVGYLGAIAAIVAASAVNISVIGFSLTSMLFFVIIHIPFVFVAKVRRVTYISLIGNFQNLAMFIAGMVFVQSMQQHFGLGMINMERYVPASMLFSGYNYVQSVSYGSSWLKPNGFFMLETSFASQLLAMAIITEAVLFKRWWVLLILALALVLTFGGTGTVMVLTSIPFLLPYISRRMVLTGVVATPIVILVAAKSGFLDNALGRMGEINQAGTSGQGHLLGPFIILRDTIANIPSAAISGIGSGVMSPYIYSMYDMLNPVAKAAIEYGLPAGLAWFFWFHACTLASRVPVAILWVVLFQFDWAGGGLLIPLQTYYCLLLCAMIVPEAAATRVAALDIRRPQIRFRTDKIVAYNR
jgi:hypothetical protein